MKGRMMLLWGLGILLSSAAIATWLATSGWAGLPSVPFEWGGRTYRLSEPRFLYLLALLPLLAFGAKRSLTGLTWQQLVLSFLLRSALLATLVLSLARPVEITETDRVCATVLVDVSASIGDEALKKASSYIDDLLQNSEEKESLRVLAFGRDAHLVPLKAGSDEAPVAPTPADLRAAATGEESNIAFALRMARAFTETDCVPHYLLLSDGIETSGDAQSAISLAQKRGVHVSTVPLAQKPPPDVAVLDVDIPNAIRVGEPFDVRVSLRTTEKVSGTLHLFQGNQENGLGGRRKLELTPGHHVEVFPSVVRMKGEVIYRAEFVTQKPDHFKQNNSFATHIDVPGPPRVLIVDRKPDQARYLARALVAQQFDVDVRPPSAFPQTRSELDAFSFAILSDVPRAEISRGAEQLLTTYVRSGGGLLYAGGEAAYGPGGWQGSQLEKILPVRMDSSMTREIPGVAMSLVIDRSGSMTGLPLQMAKEACIATLSVLAGSDLIEVIAFDSRPNRFVRMQRARYRSRIESSLLTIQPGGGTEIFSSLDMAYQDLAAIEARKKHIILLTDGNASSEGIYELAVAAFSEGITITTVGLGSGANAELLRMISEAGGGRFHHAEDPSSLPRIFTRETELVSQETTVTDWFPAVVVRRPRFLSGIPIASAPYLRGFTRTQMRPAPAELILATDTGEPLLARKPIGLGWTLAWTADLKARWSTDWLRWNHFGRFLAQLIRFHQFADDTEMIDMDVSLQGRNVVASFDAFDESGGFDSHLQSKLTILPQTDSKQEQKTVSFEKAAPGRYVARALLPGFGSYALLAAHQRRGDDGRLSSAGISRGSVSLPYPAEYRDLQPREALLETWGQTGGGRWNPDPRVVLSGDGDSILTEEARQNQLIFLGLALFLLDLLVRRVRLFDRKFKKAFRHA